MNYSLFLLPSVQKDLDRISSEIYKRCRTAFLKIQEQPRLHGSQKLTGEEGYRYRIGDYRILYRIDDSNKKVFVYRVKHRREVYR